MRPTVERDKAALSGALSGLAFVLTIGGAGRLAKTARCSRPYGSGKVWGVCRREPVVAAALSLGADRLVDSHQAVR